MLRKGITKFVDGSTAEIPIPKAMEPMISDFEFCGVAKFGLFHQEVVNENISNADADQDQISPAFFAFLLHPSLSSPLLISRFVLTSAMDK